MPYQLQDSDTGTLLQERIDSLDSVIDELNDIDEESLKDEVLSEYDDGDADDEELEWDDDNEEMTSALEEKIGDAIDEAISNLDTNL